MKQRNHNFVITFCQLMAASITTNDISTPTLASKVLYGHNKKSATDIVSELDPKPKEANYCGFNMDFKHNLSIVYAAVERELNKHNLSVGLPKILFKSVWTVLRRGIHAKMTGSIHTTFHSLVTS